MSPRKKRSSEDVFQIFRSMNARFPVSIFSVSPKSVNDMQRMEFIQNAYNHIKMREYKSALSKLQSLTDQAISLDNIAAAKQARYDKIVSRYWTFKRKLEVLQESRQNGSVNATVIIENWREHEKYRDYLQKKHDKLVSHVKKRERLKHVDDKYFKTEPPFLNKIRHFITVIRLRHHLKRLSQLKRVQAKQLQLLKLERATEEAKNSELKLVSLTDYVESLQRKRAELSSYRDDVERVKTLQREILAIQSMKPPRMLDFSQFYVTNAIIFNRFERDLTRDFKEHMDVVGRAGLLAASLRKFDDTDEEEEDEGDHSELESIPVGSYTGSESIQES